MVQQDPKLALQHQMTIIECLDHPDLIIKREVRLVPSFSGINDLQCRDFCHILFSVCFMPADAGVALSHHKLPECYGHCREDAGVPTCQQRRLYHHRLGGEGGRAGRKISFCCFRWFSFTVLKSEIYCTTRGQSRYVDFAIAGALNLLSKSSAVLTWNRISSFGYLKFLSWIVIIWSEFLLFVCVFIWKQASLLWILYVATCSVCRLFFYYKVFSYQTFVHMHLTTNGSLRLWTQCSHWVETWCSRIYQTVSLSCSLKVNKTRVHLCTIHLLSFSCVMWWWPPLANDDACFSRTLPGFDSAEEDRKLRLFAVDSYVSLLQQEPDKLPQRFLQVISWVSLPFAFWQLDGKEKKMSLIYLAKRQ